MSSDREPAWWVRDVLVAFAIGAILLAGQWKLDNRRADFDREREDQRSATAERLENLRFIRERSSPGPASRPFASFDLRGMSLDGLHLERAVFRDAQLQGASLESTILVDADFEGADLSGANLFDARLVDAKLTMADLSEAAANGADFSDAFMWRTRFTGSGRWSGADLIRADFKGAHLIEADLRGVDLSRALNLGSARVEDICSDGKTEWPAGITAPPSNPSTCTELDRAVG